MCSRRSIRSGSSLALSAARCGELEAQDDVPGEDAVPAPPGSQRPLVLDRLARVVQENSGHREVGIHLGIERQKGAPGSGHVDGVLEQAVAVGMVHLHGRGRRAEGVAQFVEDRPHGRPQRGTADRFDRGGEFRPQRRGVLGRSFHQIFDGGGGQLLGLEDGRAAQARRQPALEAVGFPLDPDRRPFGGSAQGFETPDCR